MSLGLWLREGARTLCFRPPRTGALQARPSTVAMLLALLLGIVIGVQRLAIEGPTQFDFTAIHSGWLSTLLALGTCWIIVRSRGASGLSPDAPTVATLFALLLAQQLCLSALLGLLYIGVALWMPIPVSVDVDGLLGSAWLMSLLWFVLGALVLLWREAPRRLVAQAAVVVYGVLSAAVQATAPEVRFWIAAADPAVDAFADGSSQTGVGGSEGPAPLALNQEMIEAQARALPAALDALAPGRPGVVDLYAITFAPYADEDVFSREATLVTDLMRSRFDAQQRVVQLQNHASSVADLPWATPLNLHRAIQGVAARMNRDEDILFIHLTSHGARDGQLAASLEPLAIDSVTPQQLNTWLEEAGVRYRVISISACYSGSWIAPLSGPGTLVMTAADADHTSYGCGSLSPLTFFGRAMYDEQLRRTHSFEQAFGAVRPVIEQREKEAGKTDGHSNPQIAVGAAIRDPLRSLQQRLDATPPAP
ncbi:MAG: C13 family peptidase [Burkholderiales bacterium]